jgi:hypothetical protein
MWKHRRTAVMTISSALLAVAPKCPICFLAYFGIFGVATSTASEYRAWLPPLTAIWLVFTVGMLVFKQGGQRRYGPALLGFLAAVALLAARFILNDQLPVYAGIAALVVAAGWRAWCLRPTPGESCRQCEQLSLLHDNEAGVKRAAEVRTYGTQ